MKYQGLREVFKITQWKDGCVYRTKSVGFAWVTFDYNPPNDGNLIFNAVSTRISGQLLNKTIRTVNDDVQDMDITTLAELGVK